MNPTNSNSTNQLYSKNTPEKSPKPVLEKKLSSISQKDEIITRTPSPLKSLRSMKSMELKKSTSFSQFKENSLTPSRVNSPKKLTSGSLVANSPDTGSMLHTYVDEVLASPSTTFLSRQKSSCSVDPIDMSFDEQVAACLASDIPYVSKAKKLKSIWPKHTSERRYRIIDIGKRLKRDDGGLVRIRLSSECIDDDLLHIICENLYSNTIVQHIMLNNNKITDNGVKKLVKALKRHPSIHTLWLGGNMISDRGVLYLCGLLRHNRRLKEVNLSNKWPELRWELTDHDEHPHITSDGAALLAELLSTPQTHGGTLHNLSLNQQRILDRGAILLFRSIPLSNLRTLSLSDNKLTDQCCEALSEMLFSTQSNLEYLNLSKNQISDEGIRLIAPTLKINQILTAFDLSYNRISQIGFDLLLDSLYINPTMRAMSLHNNLTNDTSIEIFLKNRVMNNIKSYLERSNLSENERGILTQFINTDGFLDIMTADENNNGEENDDDIISISTLDTSPKERVLTSLFGSGYIPKMIRDRLQENEKNNNNNNNNNNNLTQQLSQSQPQSQQLFMSSNKVDQFNSTNEKEDIAHHLLAMKMIGDSNSQIGAYGKRVPSRGLRIGSPMPTNPFMNTTLTKKSNEFLPQITLGRCNSHELNVHSHESLLSCSFDGVNKQQNQMDDLDSKLFEGIIAIHQSNGEIVSPSRKLKLYRSLSSKLSTDSNDGNINDNNNERNERNSTSTISKEKTTTQLMSRLLNTQDSFEFEDTNMMSVSNEEEEYLKLKNTNHSNDDNDEEKEKKLSQNFRKSQDLGKITGIPYFGSFAGTQPIRSATQRHRDSCNHLMYLQVLTPADPPGTIPYPVVKIGKDHLETIKRIKEYKQTPQYKIKKRNAMMFNRVPNLKESLESLPPTTFWSEWKRQVNQKYPEGIDKASGCQSVTILQQKEDLKQLQQNKELTRRKQINEQLNQIIEKQKQKKQKALEERIQAIQSSHSNENESVVSIIQPPRTQISEKYLRETSMVGVGELYRQRFVNVTQSVDKKRLMMNEITTENLIGLKVNQTAGDIVAPHHDDPFNAPTGGLKRLTITMQS